MKSKLAVLAISLGIASGCSSIISKSDYTVAVSSNPAGANFSITNRAGLSVHSGVTPSSVMLKSSAGFFKGETYTIELLKDGYSPKIFTLTSSVDGWYFGNLLLGGLIGMLIVDPATGAMYNLPTRADINLDPLAADGGAGHTLQIATTDQLTAQQKKYLREIK